MKQSNIQQELANVLEQLQVLQQTLNETQEQVTSFADYDFTLIQRYAQQQRYEQHPLSQASAQLKYSYCTILASIVTQMTQDVTTPLICLTRLHEAIAPEASVMTLLQSATQLDECLFDEFLPQMSGHHYRLNFIVDALVLSSCQGQPTLQVLHYIAELANLLGLTQAELELVTILSQIILSQDQAQFRTHFSQLNPILDYFLYYTQSFVDGLLVANQRHFKFSSTSQAAFPLTMAQQAITSDKVEITGASFDYSLFPKAVHFQGNTLVHLQKCTFTTSQVASLATYFHFQHVEHVLWEANSLHGVVIQTQHSTGLMLNYYQAVQRVTITELTLQYNQFSVDLGELASNQTIAQTPDTLPMQGVFMFAEPGCQLTLANVTISDTHTSLHYAIQNVLFGGTEFKKRQVVDAPTQSLFAGFQTYKQTNVTQTKSTQLKA